MRVVRCLTTLSVVYYLCNLILKYYFENCKSREIFIETINSPDPK